MRPLIILLTIIVATAVGGFSQDASPSGPRLDVSLYEIQVEIIPENSFLKGTTTIHLEVLVDTIALPFELNSRLSLVRVVDPEGVTYPHSFDNFNSSRMLVRGDGPFRAGTELTLIFSYDGTLDREEFAYLDDVKRDEKAVVHPDGALLLSEGLWFPSHNLPLDRAMATMRVAVPLGFTVVAAGELQPLETEGISEIFTWVNQQPTARFPVTVARYYRQQFDKMIPMTFFVTEDFKGDLEPVADVVGNLIGYYKELYGSNTGPQRLNLVEVGNVNLPDAEAPGLMLLESDVLKSLSSMLFEAARRTAFHWWATEIFPATSGDVWLSDAFATYAALSYLEKENPDQYEAQLARLAIDALKYEERAPISTGLDLGAGTPPYQSIVESKGAWVLYMLRQLIGNDVFSQLFTDWFGRVRTRTADTADFLQFVNQRTGDDYRWFFTQWVDSTGVPEFDVQYRVLKRTAGGFVVRGQIKQDLELFRMPVDIRIETKGQPEEKNIRITGKNTSFRFETETLPVKFELDPAGKILHESDRMRVLVHLALGEEYQAQGEYVTAIREFEKAKVLAPLNSQAHYRLGETFFLQHSYSNAANSLRDALNGDLRPDWVQVWTHIHLGKIFDILGQRTRALAEYQKAVNTENDHLGAQAEAQKYLKEPYNRPRSLIN